MRKLLGFLALAMIILGFAAWRFDLGLPIIPIPFSSQISPYWTYLLIGVIIGVAVIGGKIIGVAIGLISLLPLGYCIVQLLFNKSVSWSAIQTPAIWGGGLLALAVILFTVGSETVALGYLDFSRDLAREIECSQCRQYLGTVGSYQSPCPRCGGNRTNPIE